MDADFMLRVLEHSPSASVTDVSAGLLKDIHVSLKNTSRVPTLPHLDAAAADLYQGTRTPAPTAELVARSTSNRGVIAKLLKERRVGVLTALSANPHLGLPEVLVLHDRARDVGILSDLTKSLSAAVARIAAGGMTLDLFDDLLAAPSGISAAVLTQLPDLTADQFDRLVTKGANERLAHYLKNLSARTDLARFPVPTLEHLAAELPGHNHHLATYSDLFSLPASCVEAAIEAGPEHVARRTDLPADVVRGFAVTLEAEPQYARSPHGYRTSTVIRALASNPAVDPEVFASWRVGRSPHTLGRFLRHRLGDDASAWETALRLAPDFKDATLEDLVSASQAL